MAGRHQEPAADLIDQYDVSSPPSLGSRVQAEIGVEMAWVRGHRRRTGLFTRSTWVRSHYRRSPRRGVPVVPIVIAVVVILVLIALF